jgi:WD40 repeat protein
MTGSQASSSLGAIAAATAVVFVGGQRVGSAVLVDERLLLTAGHVVRRAGASGGEAGPAIEVLFPAASGGPGTRVPTRQVPLDAGATAVDASMLELAVQEKLPGWFPAPVSLSPRRRLPGRVGVFGFPREEKALRGVWREFDTAGPAADGTVQLDWAGDAGTLPGHSGGPVIDPVTGTLVGVLVQGSQAGLFDRFLPLTAISPFYTGLPFPWLTAGADARSHFVRRSRGQRSHSRGGDLFRGRQAALDAVREWLTNPQTQGRPMVLTGQPGAGKSAVVARVALGLEADRAGPGLAFHSLGAVHDELLAAVADLTGVEHADTCEALLDAVDSAPDVKPMMIVVDALDEAASNADRRQIVETLVELAALPQFRVVVATRPLAAGDRDRYRFGALLPALGIASPDSPALVDLDTNQYFEAAGLHEFAMAVLTQYQAKYPGPVGAAWMIYRSEPALLDRLAAVIATRARRNYLVAAMAAVPLSTAEQPVDPASPDFESASIPSGVGEALAKFLDHLPESQQPSTRTLLTALAYARGGGINDHTWMAFSEALGYPASTADLDRLRTSIGADYLVQTITDGEEPVTRLFHQALVDELLTQRHQPSDERALLAALRPSPGTSWAGADTYALTYAADHANSARQLLSLMGDPSYLVHADLSRLPSLLGPETGATTDPIAVIVRQVAARANPLPPARRARLLALTAAHFGLSNLQQQLAAVCGQPFTPVWAHSLGFPHTELTAQTAAVNAVALGRFGDRDVIVSGCSDNTVRVWDAATGQPRGEPLTGRTGQVRAVALGRIGERDVIVSGSWDGTAQVWDADSNRPLGRPLAGHTDTIWSVAFGRIGDRDVIVSGSQDKTVRVWDAATRQPYGEPLTGHDMAVGAVAVGRIGGRDVIVSGGWDGMVQIWDGVTGQPHGKLLSSYLNAIQALALGRIDGRDVIVSGGWDNMVRVWDAGTGQLRGEPLTGHTDHIETVTLGRINDRDVIVSGSSDDTVRVWDAATGQPRGEPLTGHSRGVRGVAVGRIGDRDVIVSGSWDGTVRVWDAVVVDLPGRPLTGHIGSVWSVVDGRVGGRAVIVSGGSDNTVRVWDAGTGQARGEPLTGHTDDVWAVALGRVGDRDVIVSGSSDDTVRVWDAATGQPRGEPLQHPALVFAVALGRIGRRDVIVSGSSDNTVRVSDAATGQPRGEPLTGHTDSIIEVALGRIGRRDVIVSGSRDNTVRVWDAATGQPRGEPLTGHTDSVRTVVLGRVGDRDVIVSGGGDGTVRVWDAATGQPRGEPLTGHTGPVEAVALGRVGDRDVIVSGSWDNTVRVWDFAEGESTVIDLLGVVEALTLTKDGSGICLGAGHTICMFKH